MRQLSQGRDRRLPLVPLELPAVSGRGDFKQGLVAQRLCEIAKRHSV